MSAIVFMFSGQGSQYYQMARGLYEQDQSFREWMHELDATAHLICGRSILAHLYDKNRKKSDIFDQTLYTHPAIFMVEYALAEVLLKRKIKPDYVIGTSIGEFASAAISGVISFEESLVALIKQAEVLENHCEKGGMIAIIDDPNIYHKTPLLRENSELASINFHSHFVVSSKSQNLNKIEKYLKEKQITYQALPVTKAFHSPYIDQAADIYKDFLGQKYYKDPTIPLISCVHGSFLTTIDSSYFWDVVRKPIQFQKALFEIESKNDCIYLDLGPSGTLANFVKYNLSKDSKSMSFAVVSPFGQDMKNLEIMKEILRR